VPLPFGHGPWRSSGRESTLTLSRKNLQEFVRRPDCQLLRQPTVPSPLPLVAPVQAGGRGEGQGEVRAPGTMNEMSGRRHKPSNGNSPSPWGEGRVRENRLNENATQFKGILYLRSNCRSMPSPVFALAHRKSLARRVDKGIISMRQLEATLGFIIVFASVAQG
jgi:hypothetical protein